MTTTLLHGDCRDILPTLPAASAQAIVTSPPYWSLRDYGSASQIGREASPDEYIEALVGVFRAVKRVLRDDGTLWLNIGDAYAQDSKWGGASGAENESSAAGGMSRGRRTTGLKDKDLIGLPWMLAFALRADGWYLRQDIIWSKPNAMPESVQDRPTRSHEYLFLFAKQARYYYDAAAIAEPVKQSSLDRINQPTFDEQTGGPKDYANGVNPSRSMRKTLENFAKKQDGHGRRHAGFNALGPSRVEPRVTRNRRSVWTIATRPYSGAHFAVFPEQLVEPCILAGSRPGDTILDPFAGSGTTMRVAERYGRDSIGIDLGYQDLQEKRTNGVQVEMEAYL